MGNGASSYKNVSNLSMKEVKTLGDIWPKIEANGRGLFFNAMNTAIENNLEIKDTLNRINHGDKKDLEKLASKWMAFMKNLIDMLEEGEYHVAKISAQELGTRHVKYGTDQQAFKTEFWKIYEKYLIECFSKEVWVTRADVKVWRHFIKLVVSWLIAGYEK